MSTGGSTTSGIERQTPRPVIGVTMGDPAGIGPEIVVKSLSDAGLRARARFHVFGIDAVLRESAQRTGIDVFWRTVAGSGRSTAEDDADVVVLDYPALDHRELWHHARPSSTGGEASFRLVEEAIAAARLPSGVPGRIDAIVTAPISKTSWSLAGKTRYAGHTELLAAGFGAARTAMMFVGPNLRVVLATVHIPLMSIRNELSIGRVFDSIEMAAQACRAMGVAHPRIAVCGLNPHAGENGILGEEEQRIIDPAIEMAQHQSIDVRGPFPADTLFLAAVKGKYDCIIAMYHDQGLIPVKLLDRDQAVNVTLGLPTIRTSPAHGTAFDIAGKSVADPGSLIAAVRLAITMSAARDRHVVTVRSKSRGRS